MPLFALICTDKPDHEPLRKSTRDAHLAYLNGTGSTVFAGPFLDNGTMTGSLVVIDVADKAAAESWAANDPYALAGLFASVRIEEWKKVIG
ncbi:YciI family protein [Pararhodobacter zhoushanensis]|uniref:YciI family protein n=1 Tax=Pararhodobacter zhoushanensis TaxID=2479545 RepID=UPI000F8EED0E|nr:YciI family protein [Pararhodobacter zhoushanensis]